MLSQVTANVDLLLDNVRVFSSTSPPYATPTVVNDTATIHAGTKGPTPRAGQRFRHDRPDHTGNRFSAGEGHRRGTDFREILYTHSGADTSPDSFTYRVSGAGGFPQPPR